MKRIVILVLLIGSITLQAQDEKKPSVIPIDNDTQRIKFQEVVNQEASKTELFKRCVYWLNNYYKDPVRVTSVRDEPTGKFVGKHRFRIYYWDDDSIKHIGGMIHYTFTIEVKDNRYRYTIDELLLKSKTRLQVEKWLDKDDPAYNPRWDSYLQQIADFVKEWSDTLKEKMKPEKVIVEDEW